MRKQMQKNIAAIVAASLVANACIAPQQHTWKKESVISTSYKPIKQETEQQDTYKIVENVSETGTLDFKVWIGKYDVNYDVVQPINLTREREYNYGRSKVAAGFVDAGLATVALGILLEAVTTTQGRCEEYSREEYGDYGYTIQTSDCIKYEYYRGSVPAHLVLLAGASTAGFGSWAYWGMHKKDRPTKNYREVEIPAEIDTRNLTDQTLLETVPAINAPVTISSSYFTMNGRQTTTINTNYNGYGTMQLVPTSQNFAFSLDGLAETQFANEVLTHGRVNKEHFLSELQQQSAGVTYDVTLTVTPPKGDPVAKTIPVHGFEIPQKAMENIIMGL